MKTLLRHLLANNWNKILARSLMNCHVKGLHSIMLLESPGQSIRMYIAMPGNELWKNDPANQSIMTLGYHTHHCNLTLEVLRGTLENHTITSKSWNQPSVSFHSYLYQSQITTGTSGFEPTGDVEMYPAESTLIWAGENLYMAASEIHTVSCSPNRITAWLVYEGQEDPRYDPTLYTTADMSQPQPKGLYRPMVKEELDELTYLVL